MTEEVEWPWCHTPYPTEHMWPGDQEHWWIKLNPVDNATKLIVLQEVYYDLPALWPGKTL